MTISVKTRVNWMLDAMVFVSALLAGLSGVYFLYAPSGGYQGGRNPQFGLTLLFNRTNWSNIHTWGSVILILSLTVHVMYHWSWIENMLKKMLRIFSPGGSKLSRGGKINLAVNFLIGLSFLLTALSGIYFLFAPVGGLRGGSASGWDPGFVFSRTTWDLIHTWSGVAMILAAMLHFLIHWRWIKNVTSRFFGSLWPVRWKSQSYTPGRAGLDSPNPITTN